MPRALRIGLLVVAVFAAACARQTRDALLLRIDGVEQARERPGELVLRGDGFPQGMRGEARLRGALYAVGRAPLAVDLRAPCRALGPSRARIELDALVSEVPGEGPFEGQIELRFGTRADAQLVGRSELVLFRVGKPPSIEQEFAAGRHAAQFQRALGIELMEESELGLSIAELRPDSPAQKAGLSVHDQVLRVEGRPLQLARDLVGSSATRELLLEVRRARESTTRVLRISNARSPAAPELLLVLLALCLGAGVAAALASTLPAHILWAPARREYWLLVCCAVCTVCVGALIVRDVDPLLSRMCQALVLGAAVAILAVYLRRRFSPTLRTTRDPNLAPLL